MAVAKGFGIADAYSVDSDEHCGEIASRAAARQGPTFVQVRIDADEPPRALPPPATPRPSLSALVKNSSPRVKGLAVVFLLVILFGIYFATLFDGLEYCCSRCCTVAVQRLQ